MKRIFAAVFVLCVLSSFAAEKRDDFSAWFPPDRPVLPELREKMEETLRAWRCVFVYDLLSGLTPNQAAVRYIMDKKESAGQFGKIGYLVYLVPREGDIRYVWATMEAFTTDPAKIGVPTKQSGAVFQQRLKGLTVLGNVPGLVEGSFPRGGAIEFWPHSYHCRRQMGYSGASNDTYDFDDFRRDQINPGYGSMQIHNVDEKQTVFAFNKWRDAGECDLGIGNNPDPDGNPDWTGSTSGKDYVFARLLVFVAP